ncbi:hypothetical protein N9A94_08445 [Akkermansiaceae bacterium]|nr:hypothetical protein [Akkermansiaceae bacterium]MDB4537933.1 hypothetical protein [Akkermansiaceae bacterium]
MRLDPVNPDAVAALQGVKHSFQTDRNFQEIYRSSDAAGELAEIAPTCLRLASKLAGNAELGSLYRMQASSDYDHFIIIALNPEVPNAPGPRLFGLHTDHSTDVDHLAVELTSLL